MRHAAVVLAAVMLAAGVAGALSLGFAPAGASEQETQGDAAHREADGPHVRFEFRNDQARDQRVTIVVRADGDEEEVLHRSEVVVPSGGHRAVAVELPQARYRVERSGESVAEDGTHISWSGGGGIDTRGCDGTFLSLHGLTRKAHQGPHAGERWEGCLAKPPALARLLAQADAAGGAPLRGRTVAMPAAHDLDGVTYQVWSLLSEPDWDKAYERAFQWEGRAPFVDAWGREVQAVVLRDRGEVPLRPSDFQIEGCGPLGETYNAGFERPPMPAIRFFAPRSAEEEAHPKAWASMWSEGMAFPPRPLECGEQGYRVETPLAYRPHPWSPACFLRPWFQGGDVREGERWPAEALCGRLPGHGAEWVVGPKQRHLGHEAVPLYRVARAGDFAAAAVAWIAEGIPYPIEVEWVGGGGGTFAGHHAVRLVGHSTAGDPLPVTGPDPSPPKLQKTALQPLHGPPMGEAARARFAFPLDEAVDRALLTAGISSAAPVLLDPDAVLGGAVLRHRREAAPTGGSTVEVDSYLWSLAFASPASDPVFMTCERKVPVVQGAGMPQPSETCRQEQPSLPASQFLGVPRLGRHDLPTRTITFDEALARWDATLPDTSGAPVRLAAYLPFPHHLPWDAPFEDTVPGSILVGVGVPATPLMVPGPDPDPTLSYLMISLEEGRTLAASSGKSQIFAPNALPLGLHDGQAGGQAGDRPLQLAVQPSEVPAELATAGLLASILAYLARGGLGIAYTRLTRPELLTQDVRRRVHALVAAQPGIHLRDVARHIGGGNGPAEYHLRVLAREGYVASVRVGGKRHYFLAGKHSAADMRRIAALRHGQAGRVFDLVQAHPGISVTALATRADMTLANASKTTRRLEAAGLLTRERAGREVRLRARGERA